jgi:hypothetical protein
MTNHPIGHALTKLGEWATQPAAFGRRAPLRRDLAVIGQTLMLHQLQQDGHVLIAAERKFNSKRSSRPT